MDNISVSKIEHSKIDSLRNSLLPRALNSAKIKAETIAANIGVSIGNVINVNESYQLASNNLNSYNDQPFTMNQYLAKGYSTGVARYGNTISFEKIHLSKAIIVKFEIK